ncbi:hypothetical protein GC163_11610 [bacterium]|nr:hypothetical protein [bacterium]
MTYTVAVWGTLVRAVLVTLAAWPVVQNLEAWVSSVDGSPRRWRLAAVLLPFLFPELLVGYAYAPAVAGLPIPAEIATKLLLIIRIIPVGVVARMLTPTTLVTPSAIHCRRLQLRTWHDRYQLWRLWCLGPLRQACPALMLMLLVNFQEFELAALLKSTSWTDWLFVQQVGGLSLGASLQACGLPLLLQLAMIGVAIVAVERTPLVPGSTTPGVAPRAHSRAAVVLLGLMWIFGIVIPAGVLVAGLPTGLWQLAGQPSRGQGLIREMLTGLAVAGAAASAAWVAAGVFITRFRRPVIGLVCCLPGLLGSLILGLALVAMFQWPLLAWVYATPVRWLIGASLATLPRAMLLRLWLERNQTAGLHLSQLLSDSPIAAQRRQGQQLHWRLVEQPIALALGLLTCWSYLDLTTAYLLAPNGMPSGMVRLYNFMHFGRTSALSAEALVLMVGPWGLMWGLARLWRGLRS